MAQDAGEQVRRPDPPPSLSFFPALFPPLAPPPGRKAVCWVSPFRPSLPCFPTSLHIILNAGDLTLEKLDRQIHASPLGVTQEPPMNRPLPRPGQGPALSQPGHLTPWHAPPESSPRARPQRRHVIVTARHLERHTTVSRSQRTHICAVPPQVSRGNEHEAALLLGDATSPWASVSPCSEGGRVPTCVTSAPAWGTGNRVSVADSLRNHNGIICF